MPTILLIDPDIEGTSVLREQLEGANIDVVAAADARTGFELASKHRPACILLCVELSGSSGYALCNKLKRDPELCRLPLILASSTATPATFEEHARLRTHADGYLHKPYELGTTLRALAGFVPALEALKETLPEPQKAAGPKVSSAHGELEDEANKISADAPGHAPAHALSPAARDLVENAVDLHASTQMLSLAELRGSQGDEPSPERLIGEVLADLGHTEPPEPEPISAKLELPFEPTPPSSHIFAPVAAATEAPQPSQGEAPPVHPSAAAHHFAAQMSAPWATQPGADAPEAVAASTSYTSSEPSFESEPEPEVEAEDDDAHAQVQAELLAANERIAALEAELDEAQRCAQKAQDALDDHIEREKKIVALAQDALRSATAITQLLTS